jgi:hypothetical protein
MDMNKYELVFEDLQKKVFDGKISYEDAEKANQAAFDKYVKGDDLYIESSFKDEPDIFYNKVKYENGDINLLFITGYSGGGKSTFSNTEKKINREVVDMDKVILFTNKDNSYFQRLGKLVDEFMNRGPGKKYRKRPDENIEVRNMNDTFRKDISKEMVKFSKSYAEKHKFTKFVLEGVWIYRYIEPQEIDDCAVYIKGTSLTKSTERAINRDMKTLKKSKSYNVIKGIEYKIGKSFMAVKDMLYKHLEKFQRYFGPKYEKQKYEQISQPKKLVNAVKHGIHDVAEKIVDKTK